MTSSQPLQGIELIDCALANVKQGITTATALCGYGDQIDTFRQALEEACGERGIDISEFSSLFNQMDWGPNRYKQNRILGNAAPKNSVLFNPYSFTIQQAMVWCWAMSDTKDTIFSKIIRREIPADIVYEDELAIAFKDVNPQAPVHILVIPKQPIAKLADAESQDHRLMGHLLLTVKRVAEQAGLSDGYRVVINNGPAGGQTVYHLHLHILGGRPMAWPPGWGLTYTKLRSRL